MNGYLLARAGGKTYGLRLDQILEVVDGFDVSRVPTVHASVRGVTRMRETSVPLVHFASLIANEPAPDVRGNTAVLASCGGARVAFEVDDVDAVGDGVLEPVPEAWSLAWVCGMVSEDGALVPVVDLDVLVERLSAAAHGELE